MSVNGKINGYLTNPKTIASLILAMFAVGGWAAKLQADINSKAEQLDVAIQQTTIIQTLKNIDSKLKDIQGSVEKIDERQRQIKEDVAKLKAKQE